ncbi:MAG TPA: hypothetical protein VF989_01090 [Polyangiaceae bacterium]|jgi:hypothetical protein
MPKTWNSKRERQYQRIKESQQKRGTSVKRAKEIAARTVNKQRRQSGQTPNRRTQGTGNPNLSLSGRTRDELYNRAKQLRISGRSKMSKSELMKAIRSAA